MVDYVQCPSCGWVHYEVRRDAAQFEVARFNTYAERAGIEQRSALENYMTCSRCGQHTATFKRFRPEREPGYTMQPVVVGR